MLPLLTRGNRCGDGEDARNGSTECEFSKRLFAADAESVRPNMCRGRFVFRLKLLRVALILDFALFLDFELILGGACDLRPIRLLPIRLKMAHGLSLAVT
jgi:hypothetical protein